MPFIRNLSFDADEAGAEDGPPTVRRLQLQQSQIFYPRPTTRDGTSSAGTSPDKPPLTRPLKSPSLATFSAPSPTSALTGANTHNELLRLGPRLPSRILERPHNLVGVGILGGGSRALSRPSYGYERNSTSKGAVRFSAPGAPSLCGNCACKSDQVCVAIGVGVGVGVLLVLHACEIRPSVSFSSSLLAPLDRANWLRPVSLSSSLFAPLDSANWLHPVFELPWAC